MKTNPKITKLLEDFEFVNSEFAAIIRSLRKTILSLAPKAEEKVMYGGIVFISYGRMFCGLFLRKQFVTMEFGRGY